jgi:predicted NBD/HSP70 family sugar kinase
MKRIYLQKAKSQIARPNTIRDINRQIVLNYVRDRAPISRAEIARETNLQRSTVSSIVDALVKAGLIEDIGTGSSTGGRKPTLLRIKSGSPVAIGVDVTPRTSTIAVADLAGNLLDTETFPTSQDAGFMSEQIIGRVESLSEKYADEDLEVGISLPGVTDQESGNVVYIPYFRWRDWDVAQAITEVTGMPVTIDNDANAIALAELWFGREKIRNVRNFITVLVAEGVGTGIVFDGQVYRGDKGDAGEFGHMIVGEAGPVPCSCGGRSCWESHASNAAVIARYRSLFNGSAAANGVEFSTIVGLANSGEEQAIKALVETAKYIGIGISNLIVGLSPQAVVVSGSITDAWNLIADEVHDAVEKGIRRRLPKTVITASSLGARPTLTGAISLVLAKKFSSAS